MLSVIIPTRRRWHMLLPTLDALGAQDAVEADVEIVTVLDGPGAPGPRDWHRRLPNLTVVEQAHSGQAAARNRGAAAAQGEVLLFLDDDVLVEPGFLRAVIDEIVEGADVVLSALRVEDASGTLVGRMAREDSLESIDALAAGDFVFDRMLFAATAVRRSSFEALEGFDEAFTAGGAYGNEDVDLGYRLLAGGARVAFAAEATATTSVLTDPEELLRRAASGGRNDVRLARKHPELAGALFGRKLEFSRIHRSVSRVVLALPWAVRLDLPLRWLGARAATGRWSGRVAHRVWFAARAVRYWSGVADEGGRTLVRPEK